MYMTCVIVIEACWLLNVDVDCILNASRDYLLVYGTNYSESALVVYYRPKSQEWHKRPERRADKRLDLIGIHVE